MNEKLQLVKPYGMIYCGLESYFLIKPEPLPKDGWQGDNCYRFLVVPIFPDAIEEKGKEAYQVYPYMRHIVTTEFTIEYKHDMEEIHVPIPDEIEVTKTEMNYDKENTDPDDFPF